MAFKHASDTTYPCPICGKENTPHETFRCRRCGRQYLCVEHLNPTERVCEDCVSIKKKEVTGVPGMVTIHEGSFFMGIDDDDDNLDAAPCHEIRLEQYLMDKDPVTNKDYKEFKPEHTYPEGMDDEPVVNVTFEEAKAYAESKGKRLPTEPEWEKAARSRDKRVYPWGKDLPTKAIKEAGGNIREGLKKYNLSPYRVRDMVGGPWEWIDSDYEPYPKGNTAISGYYQGNKVVRGGEIGIGTPTTTFERRFAHPMDARDDIGFRCCKGAPQEYDPIYAGTDIKRAKKKDMSNEPPPEFNAFQESKDKSHTLDHLDSSGTVQDAIKQTKKQEQRRKDEISQEQSGAQKGAPIQASSVPDDISREPKTSGSSIGIIIGLIVVAVVIGAFFLMQEKTDSSSGNYEKPTKSTVRLSSGNVVGPTGINVGIGDRIAISVQGWTSSDPVPPLMVMIGDDEEMSIGEGLFFNAKVAGEIKLVYRGDTVVPPSSEDSFMVVIIVEKKK